MPTKKHTPWKKGDRVRISYAHNGWSGTGTVTGKFFANGKIQVRRHDRGYLTNEKPANLRKI